MTLFIELRLFDDLGRSHGVVRYPVDPKAAYMGPRIAEEVRSGPIGWCNTFEEAVKVLQVRELRRGLLREAAATLGAALADHLQDREGWHGLDRQQAVEKINSKP